MSTTRARRLWHRLEAVNAVTYFSPECREAPALLGLEGFWIGYFGMRAAPLGPVGAGVVEATFFNFHPERVQRSIPRAWEVADPAQLLTTRADAAAAALRRLLSGPEAEQLAVSLLPHLVGAIDHAPGGGRPLFCANREVSTPSDPVAALWQAATTLREHRGDGHVALLTSADIDGCEAHVLFAASDKAPGDLYRKSRGWSDDDWHAATARLSARGLLDDGGQITGSGSELRAELERRTDELAARAYEGLADDHVDGLLAALDGPAERITASGEIMFPNPMGLPR